MDLFKKALLILGLSMGSAIADETSLPEPFQGHNNKIDLRINYDDLDALLDLSVMDFGRSSRIAGKNDDPRTGTRLKDRQPKFALITTNEANRFYFESYREEPQKSAFEKISKNLQTLPGEVPFQQWPENEQLAYWLNLYNITLISELIDAYPVQKLKKFYNDSDSPYFEKSLQVAGIDISLHDIKYKIVPAKFGYDPLLVYGFFQGHIGGPSIQTKAFTGQHVWQKLSLIATDFINSNRGTYLDHQGRFYVSELYERDKVFFEKADKTLYSHLEKHLEGSMRTELKYATNLKPRINNWRITDLYGTDREYGGGISDNPAAMLNAVKTSSGAGNTPLGGEAVMAMVLEKQKPLGRFSPYVLEKLQLLRDGHVRNKTNVTVTDITIEQVETKNNENEN